MKIPPKSTLIESFGKEIAENIHIKLLDSGFRNAKLLKEQILFLKIELSWATVRDICTILSISIRCYYNALNDKLVFDPSSQVHPSHQLLTNFEEEKILKEIVSHQLDKDCLTGNDIRNIAESMYKERTGKDKFFTRDWCRDFYQRHIESIEKVKTDCLEENRTSISIDALEKYFSDIEEVLLNPPPPCLILNFDETGFSRRPDKGKRKTVFISRNVNVKPYWRENLENHHISLVTCITAACTSLKPLFLSCRARFDKDINDTFFESWGDHFTTKKGYMTTNSMEYFLKNIVAPYVKEIRERMKVNHKCIIICDGCKSHFSDQITNILNEIGNIKFVTIPPHSSHLLQMLDVSVFGSLKRKYIATPKDQNIKSKFTQKLIRIKRAYQSIMSPELIRSGWEATGFKINIVDGEVNSVHFLKEFKDRMREECTKSQNAK